MTDAQTRPSTDRPQPGEQPDRRRQILLTLLAGLATVAAMGIPVLWVLSSQTSSASFADTEVLAANQLGAAVLDLDVASGTDPSDATGDGSSANRALFSAANLAPGDRVSGQLTMTNSGDLPLRYGLSVVEDGGILGQWLRVEVWAANGTCTPDQSGVRVVEDVQVGPTPVPLVDLARTDGVNVLAPGDSFVWCVGATLPLDTPNAAQGQRLDLSVLVAAEQVVEASP
jgi:hypothetical protein